MFSTYAFGGYNARRYRAPYGALAKLDPSGLKVIADYSAATYDGDSGGGNVVVKCEPGDIVIVGQVDMRGSDTVKRYKLINADGTATPMTLAEAGKYLRSGSRE